MNYTASIRAINMAQAHYFRLCENSFRPKRYFGNIWMENDDEDARFDVLETLHRLKAEHRAVFGTLTRVDGEWI